MRARLPLLCGVATVALAGSGCELFRFVEPEPEPAWRTVGKVQQRWFVDIPGADPWRTVPAPLVTAEGIVFVTGAGSLIALDPSTGQTRWTFAAPGLRLKGMTMAYASGQLVAAHDDGAVAVDLRSRILKWMYRSPVDVRVSALNGAPGQTGFTGISRVAMDENAAYLPAWGGSVSAIDFVSGEARWVWSDDLRFPNPAGATGAVVGNDAVFIHSWYSRVRGQMPSDLVLSSVERSTGQTLWRRILASTSACTAMTEATPGS